MSVNPDSNPPVAIATTPINLAAVAGSSSIALSWSDPAGDQRSYMLQRAVDSNFTQQVQNFPLTADAVVFTDSSVAVGTTYYYQLTAINPVGPSAPTASVSSVVLPPAPTLTRIVLNDGAAARTAITSATLAFTQPVLLNASMVSLIQSPTTLATPVPVTVANPSSDGRTWVVSWATNQANNALPDGSYSLTVHGGLITDAFGQPCGGDRTTNFVSAVGPQITNIVYGNLAPPHTLSFTFSEDVSASLSLSALKVTGPTNQVIPTVGVSWNSATLTATFTFSGALPDGTYKAQLFSSIVVNVDGVKLDGGTNGIPGVDYIFSFTQTKPTLSASGATNVNIGAPYTLTLGAITDGAQVSPSYVVNWGDGTSTPVSAAGKVTYTYSTALGPSKITVDVVDANGTHINCASLSLSVNRATVVLSGAVNANPSVPYTLTLGTVTDVGFTVSQFIVHWGDGKSNTYSAATASVSHTYAAPAVSTNTAITVDMVDNSGISGAAFTNLTTATLPLTVNPLPTIPLTGAFNANVGGTYRLLFGTPTDTGFSVSQYTVNWGDGSAAQVVPVNTTLLTHQFNAATAPATLNISVTLTDNSGSFANAGIQTVTVNPPPTDAISGNTNANLGGLYTLTVPPAIDVGQSVQMYTVNWGDSTSTSSSQPGNFTHTYSTVGPANIIVSLVDGTGTFSSAGSLNIVVNNSPTISLSGNNNANAGGTYTLGLGAVNDPGQTVSGYTVHWGDGQTSNYSSNGPVTHVYATPMTTAINVDITDGTGNYPSAGTLPISITRPTVTLGGNAGVFQGQSYAMQIGPTSDLGGSPQQFIVNWGDGSSDTYTSTGVVNHTYAAMQRVLITLDLVDNTGTFQSAGTLPLLVAPPPTIALSGAANTNVGTTYSLGLGSVSDAAGTISSLTVHWGDNTSNTYSSSFAGPATHVYGITGASTITVDVSDQFGGYPNAASLSLTVNQPSIPVTGAPNAPQGRPYTLNLGTPFDAGQTVTQYNVNWGDGTSSTYGTNGFVQHSYANMGPAIITVDLTDGLGTYLAAGSLPVTVSAPPVITLAGNSNANVGGSYALSIANIADPFGIPTQYAVNWGDGIQTVSASPGPFTHSYAAPAQEQISIDVTDSGGLWTTAGTLAVTANPAPTIALSDNSGGNANLNGQYTLNLGAVSDPGYAISQYAVNWGDGQSSNYSSAGAVTHPYTSTGPQAISVSLTDATGTFAAAGTLGVTVNPSPTVTLAGNSNANVGGTYSLNLAGVSDPGYPVSQYTVNWGDGQSTTTASLGLLAHSFAVTGPDAISVSLTDASGSFAAASQTITVNAAPSVALTGNANANVAGIYTLNLTGVTDPGYTPTQYSINWGDGQTTNSATLGSVAHIYSSVGSDVISVVVTDSTGTYNSIPTLAVTVNPTPTVLIAGNSNANQSGVYSLNLGTLSDPGYAVSQFQINWGDGLSSVVGTLGNVSHTFTSIGTDNISVNLTDATGTYNAVATLGVTVNPTPTVSVTGNGNANRGGLYTLALTAVSDPGYAASNFIINWGDGQSTTAANLGSFTHTFSTSGPDNITVTVNDSTGSYQAAGGMQISVNGGANRNGGG